MAVDPELFEKSRKKMFQKMRIPKQPDPWSKDGCVFQKWKRSPAELASDKNNQKINLQLREFLNSVADFPPKYLISKRIDEIRPEYQETIDNDKMYDGLGPFAHISCVGFMRALAVISKLLPDNQWGSMIAQFSELINKLPSHALNNSLCCSCLTVSDLRDHPLTFEMFLQVHADLSHGFKLGSVHDWNGRKLVMPDYETRLIYVTVYELGLWLERHPSTSLQNRPKLSQVVTKAFTGGFKTKTVVMHLHNCPFEKFKITDEMGFALLAGDKDTYMKGMAEKMSKMDFGPFVRPNPDYVPPNKCPKGKHKAPSKPSPSKPSIEFSSKKFCDHANCREQESVPKTFKLCGGCKKVRYCSTSCQRASWSKHKKVCTAVNN